MSAGQHWITVTGGTEDEDPDFSLECGGVTDRCRTWKECENCDFTEEEREEGEGESHGVWHQMLDGYWMVETDQCLLHALEGGESGWDIVEHGHDGEQMPPGRYPIEIQEAEEGTVYYGLLPERTAA